MSQKSPRHTGVLGIGESAQIGEPRPSTAAASKVELGLARRLLERLDCDDVDLVLWDDQRISLGTKNPAITVHLRERGCLYRLLANPDLHFGDDYTAGRITVEGSLLDLLVEVGRSRRVRTGSGLLQAFHARWVNRPSPNSLKGSRENIHHHYDIGNAFYRLWLDKRMVYTCAYFPTPETGLEAAQVAKFDHISRKLRLRPGETVVEAGCGWGALAFHMAERYGVKVRAYNISREQIAYARERIRAAGLEDRVEYVQDDYRNIEGTYDVFVSVGMLEHVGTKQYPELGSIIDRVLKPQGRGLIHSIGRNRAIPFNAWTERRIFPGAYPPTLAECNRIFEDSDLSVLDVENLRLHYAKTLEHWLERYEADVDTVREMFDEVFVRAWRLYLSGSIAAFLAGNLQLFQIVFTRGGNNDIPWTREHVYLSEQGIGDR
ncbi:MAG: cyclopropane-fatty-acyl-phospholipid synthase family protein [Gammaproteobacteria bacterium]|nr:cyclopropane-fatty-acyl-phospholipid synthase family protein [Gammaproteobacteria bacterium]